jgi:hypothetical protein
MKIVREYTINGKISLVEVSDYPDLNLTPEQVKDAANYQILFAGKTESNE